MRDSIVNDLLVKVKGDYSAIAERFSASRKHPWEEFEFFDHYPEKDMKILDLGCGNGRLFEFLKEKDIHYLGIDNNKDLLALARDLHPETKFREGDQTAIPLPDDSIDQIWNIAAFHHIPSKRLRQKSLKEQYRVLKPGSFLILTVWNLWQKKYRKYIYSSIVRNLFSGYELRDTFIPWGKEKLVERYYHAFTMNELSDLLRDCGFRIVDRFCAKRGQKTNFWNAYNICFVARKPK